ncbi:unnamed protein product [Euphydryas editha]|uniref:DUF4219 domain-containing protein n=1 Tax=Euphydryas editha TaxID=104508 RepID=A0AAU9UAV3_EUPED|nr:unnamed protein product [Euphydryas editha]
MATSIKIDRLTGDNYDTWKIHMRAILIKNDLWEYVSGSLPKPQLSDSKYPDWVKMDRKAESTYSEEVMLGEKVNPIWYIDSGCMHVGHMCNNKQLIQDFTRLDSELNLANSDRTKISDTGKVRILIDTGSEERQVDVERVFYVSDL